MSMLDPNRGYDLIGDVHGCAQTLARLLEQMGYRQRAGIWSHPTRMALFLGDLIDRGPHIRETLHLVRAMVEAGQALCLMGNHEFAALAWHTPNLEGTGYVREHNPRNTRMISKTLEQFSAADDEWQSFLRWFHQLPLLLDAGRFRMVHACWDSALIEPLLRDYPSACIDQGFVQHSALAGSFAQQVASRLLRGTDMRLPNGLTLSGQDGLQRAFFRTKFWAENPETYGDVVFQPDALPRSVAQTRLSEWQKQQLLYYGPEQPLLFVGHYWRRGEPEPLRANLACLDYSAVLSEKLVAYRLDNETQLDPSKFVWVEVLPGESF
jgi:hypothetical protein